MPTYEYLCDACGHNEEIRQKISADPIALCPACQGQDYHRVIGATAFLLKGSGWYQSDYGGKNQATSAKNSDPTGGATEKPASEKKAEKTEKVEKKESGGSAPSADS